MNREELLLLASRRRQLEELLGSGRAREIRERARISRQELARTLRIRASALELWEDGRGFPPQGVDLAYLDLLVTLDDAIGPPAAGGPAEEGLAG